MESTLLTAEAAANYLGMSKARLYHLASVGQVRSVPLERSRVRFYQVELDSYRLHTAPAGKQLELPKVASRKPRRPATLIQPDTLTAPEAARYLGMKLDTFYWQVRHKAIAFTLAGQRGKRFSRTDLDAYAAAKGITPTAAPGNGSIPEHSALPPTR